MKKCIIWIAILNNKKLGATCDINKLTIHIKYLLNLSSVIFVQASAAHSPYQTEANSDQSEIWYL